MTCRAFIIGLLLVAAINLITPYNDFDLANTYMTGFHFPIGAFFLLVLLTLVVNVCLKLVRRAWAFAHPELMLAWCMMIVGSTVPSSGLMRYCFPLMAAPSYYAYEQHPEWSQQGHLLPYTPPQLILSNQPNDPDAAYFYRGTAKDEKLHIPWASWVRPTLTWGVFLILFYLATFFACSLLRGWWVDAERLTFPVARVPMELTEGIEEEALLPALVRNKFFLIGAGLSLAFGLIRIFAMSGVHIWIHESFRGTVLESGNFGPVYFFPLAIGFAFLLPAQISFSLWFFWLVARFEFISAFEAGLPIQGGDYGPFMQWQQAGAFVAFMALMLWQARRHIGKVIRKAVGAAREVDDSGEPIGYGWTFWGLVLSVAGMVLWSWRFGMSPLTAVFWLSLVFTLVLVHARLVSQGGLFFTQQNWAPVSIVHSITGGVGFSPAAIVVANMQHAMLLSDAREVLAPHAMNALRISSVFEKQRRRLFLPAMLAALAVALVVAGWASMHVYYSTGALNISNIYGPQRLAPWTFEGAEKMITQPQATAETHWGPMALGVAVMVVLLAVRTKFYWWPIHPLGFLVATTYAMATMVLSFFLGWLAKVLVVYFGGGRMLHRARCFFLGVIAMEAFLVGVCAVLGYIMEKRIGGFIFLPG